LAGLWRKIIYEEMKSAHIKSTKLKENDG